MLIKKRTSAFLPRFFFLLFLFRRAWHFHVPRQLRFGHLFCMLASFAYALLAPQQNYAFCGKNNRSNGCFYPQAPFGVTSSLHIRKKASALANALLIGGCDKDRTCDPYDVNVVLIPLSYTPVKNKMFLHYLFSFGKKNF